MSEDLRYVATINVPGYLPMDDDPPVFESAVSAWDYLREERERAEDDLADGEEYSETHAMLANIVEALDSQSDRISSLVNDDGTGALYGGTPGYDGNHDLGLAYCVSLVEAETEDEA